MGSMSELCSVESNDSTCFPLTEQIVPKYLLTCITGIAGGIRGAFGWKRPFRSPSPRVIPALPSSPLLLHPHTALGLCWAMVNSPSSQLPVEFLPLFQATPQNQCDSEMCFGNRLCCAGFSWRPGLGEVPELMVMKDTVPLTESSGAGTESMRMFLYSSSSKYNQVLGVPGEL